MKRTFFLTLSSAVLSLNALAQNPDETPYRTQNFTGNLSNLRVETSGGYIKVEGGGQAGVKVEMYVHPNNWPSNRLSREQIEERLKDYDISLTTEGSTVVAVAKRRGNGNWDWKRALSISFKVFTPRAFATDLRTSGGSIHISRLSGKEDFTTSGGSLHLDDVTGNVKGRTSGGSIHLSNCHQDINLTTSGGSIHADNSDGTLSLRTSGGSLDLQNLKGKIEASTSGGSIRASNIEGELETGTSGGSVRLSGIAGSVRAATSGGSIEAEITRVGEYLKLSTSAGNVRVQMPLDKGLDLNVAGRKVSMPLRNFDGTADDDHIRGRINGGGVPVQISANNGNVYVNR